MQQSSTLDCSKEFPPIPCLWKIACFPQALSQSCSVCSICLHPEHVFQNIRVIKLSSAVYLQINLPCCETFQPRPRASLLLRVHEQQTQLQRNNPSDGGFHNRWHTYLQSRLRCCSFERKVDAGCFATIGAFHSKISIQRSAKDAPDKALKRADKTRKLHILKIAPA